jgi:hypothetical protein
MKKSLFFLFFTPVAVLFLYEFFCFYPKWFYLSILLIFIFLAIAIKKVVGGRFFSSDFLATLGLPLLFCLSSAAYSLMTPAMVVRQVIFVLTAIFIFLYLRNIGKEDKGVSVENIFSYASFLLVFFAFSFFYGLKVFLGIPMLYLVGLMMVLIILVLLDVFWANRIPARSSLVYVFLVSLLITQLSWSLYFLSLPYVFSGLILAIFYYIVIGIVKPFLRGSLTKKTVKVYLICGFSGIVVALFSAQWL